MKLKSNKKEGVIVLSKLSDEEFFALMDEIRDTMELFKRWEDGKGESV